MALRWFTRAMVVACGLVLMPATAEAAPSPVYQDDFADPGIAIDKGDFVGYATGGPVKAARADIAAGPWRAVTGVLPDLGPWAQRKGVWAPDVVKTSAGWVMYYSAVSVHSTDQRCIGVATAKGPEGPFEPADAPLICPMDANAPDRVPGHPVKDAGVIDAAPFQASDGQRYVVYKTQKTPSSIRMFPVSEDGRAGIGQPSRELVKRDGVVENPVMVERSGQFFLFVSRFGFADCSYATRWMRSGNRWTWSGAEHELLTTEKTGVCGPGGADVSPALDGGTRIFFHAWNRAKDKRQLYAGVLDWGEDGRTPKVTKFLAPAAAALRQASVSNGTLMRL